MKLGPQHQFKIALVPRQVPTGTTDTKCNSDREPVLCKYTGAAHVVVHVQVLRAPVYPGCEMHICGLVRHGCVEWGLVTTQDQHTYNTCHSLFCTGNTNLGFASVCIRFI